ncbi:hypothetical protein GX408_11105, partial [bacterium]|nr:hypothetical protein [bacterium]
AADRSEQNPDKIMKTTDRVIVALAPELRSRVEAIGVTGQMHGLLLLDQQRRALTPLITWQDRRCLQDNFIHSLQRKTGCPLDSGYGLATLAWLKANQRLPRKTFSTATIADYLIARLTGSTKPAIDVTNAAGWGCFDLEKLCWDDAALRRLDIQSTWLPPVVPCGTLAGHLLTKKARQWGVPAGIPITVALGDNQASLLATLNRPEEELALTLGTGAQISALTGSEYKWDTRRAKTWELRPYPGNRLLLTAAALNGGSAWAWLADTLIGWMKEMGVQPPAQEVIFRRLNRLGLAAEDTLTFEPYLRGERWDAGLQAAVHGVRWNNFNLGALSRSLAKGIFTNLHDMLPEEIVRNRKRLMGSGNALRCNPLLRRMAEQVFQLPLVMSRQQEEAACGAARNAMGKNDLDEIVTS